jgi:hypothetical protein
MPRDSDKILIGFTMLIVLNATPLPTSYDVLDAEMGTFKGGECATLVASAPRLIPNPDYDFLNTPTTTPSLAPYIANFGQQSGTPLFIPAYDQSAFDYQTNDFVGPAVQNTSTAATQLGARTLVSKGAVVATSKVLYLVDNGSTGYGTQFGSWTGGLAGRSTVETPIGPSTDQVSGKVTLYRQGLFGATFDSVAADLAPSATNMWNTGGGNLAPGAPLYAEVGTGKLTSVQPSGAKAVAYFVAYETKPGFVKTPAAYKPATPFANLFMIAFEFVGMSRV